jgi:hypothetical protein
MTLRTFSIIVALVLIAGFALLNWSAFMAPTTLSLGLGQVQAPLGLVMLVATGVVSALFLIVVAVVQARAIVEGRRHVRELQALRELADKAEVSRITELREFVGQGLRHLESQLATDGLQAQERIAQLERRIQDRLDESTRTLSAYIGEVEDKLDRRLRPGSA